MKKQILAAAAAAVAFVGAASAGELKPMNARSIDLGAMKGVAYYTVEADGYHVIATLAEEEGVAPIRFEAMLVSGQTIVLSTPRAAGLEPALVEISRIADRVVVQDAAAIN